MTAPDLSVVLTYLKNKEWSMGNGQCPECCGVSPKWFGHPLYLKISSVGHKKGCELAASIKDVGGVPIMIGDLSADHEYETCTSENGFRTIRIKK